MIKELTGMNRLFSWLKVQLVSFNARSGTANSQKEKQAIQETLNACDELQKANLEEWNFKAETLSLIEKVACIYHPDATAPMEQACLGDICDAVHEANQKVLNIIRLPRINCVTQFRVIQVFENLNKSLGNKNNNSQKTSLLRHYFLGPLFLIWQKKIVRSLLTQWILLIGEGAIKVYRNNIGEGEVEAETILNDWDDLQDEPELFLPENVKQIAESSKKKVLFSTTVLSWKQAGQIYFGLANEIARYYNSESSYPLYEVRIFDLLKSAAESLEGIGRLRQKPVLNKLLKIRISQLTKAREITVPLGKNKVFEWTNKFQVGRIAKWSQTLYRTIQKKQPGILFRDVAFGLITEGGKRWLVLYFHDKIAVEANKLYSHSP
ncbi:MAG: hypothetical protein VX429_04800 [Nitrospinota bacterium]|nr:hypothetical protein [Nitrospinota bacterium]